MARKIAGKRLRTNSVRGSRVRAKEGLPRYVVQVMVAGSVFVLLVMAKLFLPEQVSGLRAPVSQILEKDMDVTAVFSAVGRAFSGEGDMLENVYQAVFGPQDARGDISGQGTQLQPPVSGVLDTDENRILYSAETLPENVRLEQAVLGFDYVQPVSGTVTSGFGYRETEENGRRFHYGVDLAGEDTAILAFADGTVTAAGESSSYGKYLILAHADGYTTLYAHCRSMAVSSGQTVCKGERIAEMGDTGQTTGVHLHFELQKDGVYFNPVYYVS